MKKAVTFRMVDSPFSRHQLAVSLRSQENYRKIKLSEARKKIRIKKKKEKSKE